MGMTGRVYRELLYQVANQQTRGEVNIGARFASGKEKFHHSIAEACSRGQFTMLTNNWETADGHAAMKHALSK